MELDKVLTDLPHMKFCDIQQKRYFNVIKWTVVPDLIGNNHASCKRNLAWYT